MWKQESFDDMVKLTVSMFKEDTEQDLVHMTEIMHLFEPPFQHPQRSKEMGYESKEKTTNKSSEEEAKTSIMKD